MDERSPLDDPGELSEDSDSNTVESGRQSPPRTKRRAGRNKDQTRQMGTHTPSIQQNDD